MPIVVVRTLRHEFRILAPDQPAADALAFIAIEPEIEGTTLTPVDLHLGTEHGFFSMTLPNGLRIAGSARHIIAELHTLILRDAIETEAGAPIVHCATIVGPWGRMALIGSKADGKTTLALSLMAAGYRVEGDEHLFVSDDVVARPRTVRVKQGSLDFVPSLSKAIAKCPFITTWDGLSIYSVCPSIAGTTWRIQRGRLDHLIFIEANHGGRSVMSRISGEQAFERLLSQSLLPPRRVAPAVARLRHLAMTLPAFRLSLGDLAGAQRHLETFARDRAFSRDG